MKYRRFGGLDWKVSALGFGAMRLPVINNEPGQVDEVETMKMIRYAIDQGVNYVDTAYPYHRGASEVAVGKALTEGYREKVKLATKMPTWMVNSQEDMDKALNEQLRRLQTDHVDFYLLHALEKKRFDKLKELHVFDWAENAMAERKIRYLGFSFHDEYEVFKEIVDSYKGWTVAQIQYNYMDTEYQAGTRGLNYAASKGLAVVVMEPIAGGLLAMNPPKDIQDTWAIAEKQRSPTEWALQWVWNHPEVAVALSGMTTMGQVIENVESANHSEPEPLTTEDLDLISQVKKKYSEYGFIGCTGCRYCQPCPQGVDIPEIFTLYNEYFMKNRDEEVIDRYANVIPGEKSARRCAKCGKCEELCPQKLAIRDILSKATFLLETE